MHTIFARVRGTMLLPVHTFHTVGNPSSVYTLQNLHMIIPSTRIYILLKNLVKKHTQSQYQVTHVNVK